jgi:hypothetical protein
MPLIFIGNSNSVIVVNYTACEFNMNDGNKNIINLQKSEGNSTPLPEINSKSPKIETDYDPSQKINEAINKLIIEREYYKTQQQKFISDQEKNKYKKEKIKLEQEKAKLAGEIARTTKSSFDAVKSGALAFAAIITAMIAYDKYKK